MSFINIYVDKETMQALAGMEYDATIPKCDLCLEFIDIAPLTAEVVYDGDNTEISMYVRDEMHTNGSIALHGTAKGPEVDVDDGDVDTVKIAFAVAEGVNKLLHEKGMTKECSELNEETQGVLFKSTKDGITVKIVEGRKRPDLLCTTLFGAPRMTRPYMDEVIGQFGMEDMSKDELMEAANNGDPDAMEKIAMAYLNGDDEFEEDAEQAYYWTVKSAENGNDQAMFNAGLFTAKGFGTERDFAKAAEWMRKAAEAGDDDAEECAKEYQKLADAVEKAEKGDAQAQADLAGGLMKLGGSLDQAGEMKDYEECVMWAEKAVAQGNADGYWTLALAYHHGRGVKRDVKKAIELYQKGADAGSDSCKHNLACEYMTGENIKKDHKKGFVLIKEAAENGHGLAMRDLGRCYQFANGTPGNMKKAVEWYEKALEVIDDPELERKVMTFKGLADVNPNFGEDYPEAEEDDFDESNLPEGYMDKLKEVADEIDGLEDTDSIDKEITIEDGNTDEMIDALQNGQGGFITQTIKGVDGTEKEMAIWGGYELDGYDRTLNVFMNLKNQGSFIEYYQDNDLDGSDIKDPCEKEVGYQMTIDLMDLAGTIVIRKSQREMTVEFYERDERKSYRNLLEENSGTVELDESGKIVFDPDTIEDNKHVVFAIVSEGLRRYLLKEGIVKKLYDMYDESAGVLVKVSKGGTITTKIVKGRERPDLPCSVFLLGEQICRPYIDEMLGLESNGIRPHFDPKQAEKVKVAREKKKAEEKSDNKKKGTITQEEATSVDKENIERDLKQSKRELSDAKYKWETLESEVSDRVIELVAAGIKPSFSMDDGLGPHSVGINLSFESNMDEAEDYIGEVGDEIEEIKDIIHKNLKMIDELLNESMENSEVFSMCFKQFMEWASFSEGLELEIAERTVEVELDNKDIAIIGKWKKQGEIENRKKEAEEYGVDLKDLDKHKKYLKSKKAIESANTSDEIQKAMEKLSDVKGYCDAEFLYNEASKKFDLLKLEEEKEERRKKEKEENKRKEKEEKERKINLQVMEKIDKQRSRSRVSMGLIACSMYHVVAVRPDGTVIAAGKNDHGQCNVSGWRDVIAVDCDEYGTIGLTIKGYLYYTGESIYNEAHCTRWSGIVAAAMSDCCVFGLNSNGNILVTPKYHYNSTAPDVTNWKDIVEIRRNAECIIGIDKSANAFSLVRNYYGRVGTGGFGTAENVIDASTGGYDSCILLKKDGSCSGFSPEEYKPQEIVRVYKLSECNVALLSNGKILLKKNRTPGNFSSFASNHSSEKFIAVSGSLYKAAFLTEDGKIYVVGDSNSRSQEVQPGEPFGKGFRLFNSFNDLMDKKDAAIEKRRQELEMAEKKRKEEEEIKASRREQGLCQYCGGSLKKGLIFTKCTVCGEIKNY